MLFTFYHMVLFQVITRRRIPSSHQEEMGWKEGPPCHLSVARQTLIMQVFSLSRGEYSAWIPWRNRMKLRLLSGRNRWECVCVCVCVWLQLLENPPWGGRTFNTGRAVLSPSCKWKPTDSLHSAAVGASPRIGECDCKARQPMCKLKHQNWTFQMSIKPSSDTTIRGDKAVKTGRLHSEEEIVCPNRKHSPPHFEPSSSSFLQCLC